MFNSPIHSIIILNQSQEPINTGENIRSIKQRIEWEPVGRSLSEI